MRFRLRTLLIVLAWVGLVCVAVRQPTWYWALAVFFSAAIALATSALAIIYRRGQTRAFAVGFLLLGGSIFVLLLLPTDSRLSPKGNVDQIGMLLFQQIHPQAKDLAPLFGLHTIVNSVVVILLGVMGGAIAQVIHAAPQKED